MIAHGPIHNQQPENQTDKQQNLPEAAQFQKLPALMAQPEPQITQHSFDAQNFTQQAAQRDNQDSHKKQLHQWALFGGLFAPDDGRQVNGRGNPGGGDPENHQLQVPGFRPAVWNQFGDHGYEKTGRVDGVMRQ